MTDDRYPRNTLPAVAAVTPLDEDQAKEKLRQLSDAAAFRSSRNLVPARSLALGPGPSIGTERNCMPSHTRQHRRNAAVNLA